jgi:GDSL-like Lipase/Acylhydrolase family
MIKHWLTNTALVLGSLLLTGLLIEAALRVFGHEPASAYDIRLGEKRVREPFPGVRYVYPGHADYLQRWPSNPRGYFDPETNGITYRVNNYGFRDDDFDLTRNERIRIAFLGDSFCWGLGVRKEDIFATQIEQWLERRRPLGRRYEVYNFCLPGYSTAEEAALDFYVVRHFRPDVLVIWYHLNDVNAAGQNYIDREARRYIKHRADPEKPRSRWRLLGLVREAIYRRVAHRSFVESFERAYQPGHPGLESVEDALDRIQSIEQEAGVPCFLAIFPWLYRLEAESYPFKRIHSVVASRAAAEGFGVLDLFPVFEGKRDRELWVHPLDPHPNEIAHAVAARAMSEFLASRLEELGDRLLPAAAARLQLETPSPVGDPPSTEWYRAFVALSRDHG